MDLAQKLKILCIYKLDSDGITYKFDSLALATNDGKVLGGGKFYSVEYEYEFSKITYNKYFSNPIATVESPLADKTDFAYVEVDFFPSSMNDERLTDLAVDLTELCNLSFRRFGKVKFYDVVRDVSLKNRVTPKDVVDLLLDFIGKKYDIVNEHKISYDNKYIIEKTKTEKIDNVERHDASLNVSSDIDVNGMISDIKKKIIGQDEAIESIVSNIYANQRIIDTCNKDLIATQKCSILLDGSTGTGKTAIIKEVADKLSLPIVVANSGSFSATGYRGDSLIDILVKLYEKSNGDIELAQRGIVCFDEIDKLGGQSKDRELVMRRSVQQELLSFMSGAKFDIEVGDSVFTSKKVEFDTSNLTFIGMGAFTQIRDKKIDENKKERKHSIGFNTYYEGEEVNEKTYVMKEQDYIDYGLERELVGRFPLLTSTKTYSVDDFKKILTESSISPLKSFVDFAKCFGVEDVTYDDNFIQLVAEMAYRDGFGARGLQKIITDLKNSMLLDIINRKTNKINLTVDMLKKSEEKNIRKY